ncbi:long-chain fatty acid--CoA ligase [Paenarthrobacter sp. Z7-10]|uniref:long-chain-fatty-acid--CoA ligase n=1 Tax=Paenarthrobacter sp. Z7-10 TaxID=2787635 RepID=UPI0022A90017|nr:long-chain fatty acid--CoA ligase [Paenarthrobacter sp. Z7-10]MCZ2402011.1 long-chain fatty acid--CoA ligase [Paenarthrobacter sp. Z7-10]
MTVLTLAAILAESARNYPAKTAVVDGDRSYSYAKLWEQARSYASQLQDAGLNAGDVAGIMSPNVVEFPRAYYAVQAAGAVVVPVHLLLTVEEIVQVLRDSGAKLLICHSAFLAVGAPAAKELGIPLLVVGPVPEEQRAGLTLLDPDALPRVNSYVPRQAEDPAVIFYTSGTTGKPKGAILTQLNMVMNATVSAVDANDVRTDDIALGCLPLFHVFGQTASMNAIFRLGATLVLLPRFSGAAALDMITAQNVNVFHGVPTMYMQLLAAAQGRETLPQLRLCVSGGAALPVAAMEKFNAAFRVTIYEGYGLSETSPVVCTNTPTSGVKPGTVGPAVWGVEVEITDHTDPSRLRFLPNGELGEIVVRGHNVFAGYLNNPEATAAAMTDGWFHTGDLGTKDDDGFITVVDRTKDVIIRSGYNVYPREVEEVLARHPAVAQVAVIGLPDDLRGEEVCAVITLEPSYAQNPPSAGEIIAWSQEHLAKYKYPRVIRIIEALPLGPSQKILKRELRETFADAK